MPLVWACWIAWQTAANSSSRSRTLRLFSSQYCGDRHAADELHHEVRPARLGRAGVEDAGDIRMVHHRQGLPLRLEAGDHLPRVHARLDHLEGHLAADRLQLLGHEDDAEAPFADLLQQLVRADLSAGALRRRPVGRVLDRNGWHFQKA